MRVERRAPAGLRAALLAALIAAAFAAHLAAATTARADEPFTDLTELRKKMVSGDIADSVSLGRFIVARYDDYGYVSYQVAALKKQRAATPLVAILGGSSVRECLTSDDELATGVEKGCGTKVRAITLSCAMQRLPSTLAIIDNLPDGSGVIVLGIRHTNFVGTLDDARAQLVGVPLPLSSKALRDFMAGESDCDPPNSLLEGLQKYLDWYARKRGVPAFQGAETTYQRHRYDARGSLATATKQAMVPRFVQNFGTAPNGAFFSYLDFNKGLLQRCVDLAREKGYQVLLMQDPLDEAVVGTAYDVYDDMYKPVCRKLVREQGAHYVDINAQVSLLDTDFYDLSHLLASGRSKWTPALATAVAQIIRDHPAQDQRPEGRVTQGESPAPPTSADDLFGRLRRWLSSPR